MTVEIIQRLRTRGEGAGDVSRGPQRAHKTVGFKCWGVSLRSVIHSPMDSPLIIVGAELGISSLIYTDLSLGNLSLVVELKKEKTHRRSNEDSEV